MQQANTAQAKELEKKKQNLPQAIDLEGNITDIGGPLVGMPVVDARKKALELLEILENPVLMLN